MMKIIAIKVPRKGNPVIPRDVRDPAHQFGNVKRAKSSLNARYKKIMTGMRQLIDAQPKRLVTNARYEFEISAERYNAINEFIERLLYQNLLDNEFGTFQSRWWLRAHLEKSFADGLTDALQSAKNMSEPQIVSGDIASAIRSITPESAFTPQMVNGLGLVYSRVFNEMKGLADSTKVNLAETLTQSMADGVGINEISRRVKQRIGVSYSRAFRIARTEILTSYRTATRAETKDLNESVYDDSDWQMQLLWFSALIPGKNGTRKTHGAKHGEILTFQEVEEFYSKDGNAINCYCSQSPILVNKKTGETVQDELLNQMKLQRKSWWAGVAA